MNIAPGNPTNQRQDSSCCCRPGRGDPSRSSHRTAVVGRNSESRHGLDHGASAQLAATSAGLFSMARNVGAQFDDSDAVGQIVVELDLSQLYVRHVAAGRTKWVHRAANDVMCLRGPARLHRSLGQPGQGPGTRRMAP